MLKRIPYSADDCTRGKCKHAKLDKHFDIYFYYPNNTTHTNGDFFTKSKHLEVARSQVKITDTSFRSNFLISK